MLSPFQGVGPLLLWHHRGRVKTFLFAPLRRRDAVFIIFSVQFLLI